MKYALAAILVLLVAAGAYFFFRMQTSSTSPTACADAHLNVAAFGDSLVEGYGATAGHDFPSLLSTTLGVPVQNFGRSGDTTSDALARIDSVVSAQPDVVIVLLGGNDALQRMPQALTQQNLATIIQALQSAHIRVVLVGVMGAVVSDPYKTMFEDLAKTYHVTLIPNILNGIFGNSSLMSDEVHPNDAGYAKVAARIAPVVQAVCSQK